MFKFVKFSKKQRQVLNWWTESSPVKDYDGIIADGAIRSGKTACMSLSFIMWAMENFNGQNFGMCGKTIQSFRRNVFKPLKREMEATGYECEERRSENMFVVRYGDHENEFYIFGGKDEGSQDLVQGITLAGVFCDEVSLMPESFVNQATARCSVNGSKLWFNCNPAGPKHWFKVDWIDRTKERNLLHLHFTMDDNLSLAERIKERFRNQYHGVFYERYILGLWSVADGLVYDNFSNENIVKPEECPSGPCYISCDYGTQNATVFLKWKKKNGVWYCVEEFYYSGRDEKKQMTDSQFGDAMKRFIQGETVKAIIVDPAAASFIAELESRGLRVIRAKNDVLEGIRRTSTLISEKKLLFSSKCENTRKEFAEYVWDKKAADRGVDAPLKTSDHAMDAVRYFVMTILTQKAIVGTKPRGL
jgi:PBSX family phage terminase large subunit